MQGAGWPGMADAWQPTTGAPSSEDRTLAWVLQLLGILTGFLGPLILWLVKKDSSPFLDQTGRRCLNFQFSILIYMAACVVMLFTLILIPFAFLGFVAIGILKLVFGIIAIVKSNEGQVYTYPLAIKFLK
jgi:uncharacterized Tic20 family protein